MKIDSLEKLYVHELKDLHSVETQILAALPKMIDAVHDSELKSALKHHLDETKTHLKRVDGIFEKLEFEPGGHRCKGIAGVIAEGDESVKEVVDDGVRDAAVIAACQRVEHYEMAAYGVARALASKLGRSADVDVLTNTLEEEGAADRTLTQLAEKRINFVAHVG